MLPSGRSGRKWLFKSRDDGLRKVLIRDFSKKSPGYFRLVLKSKRWFTAAQANDTLAGTTLTVTVGERCFTHGATKKVD